MKEEGADGGGPCCIIVLAEASGPVEVVRLGRQPSILSFPAAKGFFPPGVF